MSTALIAGQVISGIGSLLAGRSARKAARRQAAAIKKYSEYNAELVRKQAQSDRQEVKRNAEKLSRSQRELAAQQRMNVARRGGREAGTDLLSLLNQAAKMQEDAFELQRQEDLVVKFGEQKAQEILRKAQLGQITAIEKGRATSKAYQYQALGNFAKAAYYSSDDIGKYEQPGSDNDFDDIIDEGENIGIEKLEIDSQ